MDKEFTGPGPDVSIDREVVHVVHNFMNMHAQFTCVSALYY